MLTSVNIIGTSVNTPTTVAKAAPESKPNNDIATATASSKKFDAPIIPAGAATSWVNFQAFDQRYAMKNIKNVCIVSGIAINNISCGLSIMVWPWNENKIIRVNNKPIVVTFQNNLILYF